MKKPDGQMIKKRERKNKTNVLLNTNLNSFSIKNDSRRITKSEGHERWRTME